MFSPTNLYKIPFLVQGWTGICNLNFRRLNSIMYLAQLPNVVITNPQDGDILAWDAGTQKWVNKTSTEVFGISGTTTSSTTTTTSSTTTTTSSTKTTTTSSTTTTSTTSSTTTTTVP